jgi:hypothetical protein
VILVPAALAVLVIAGCSSGLPTATVINGAGTFATSSSPGQISVSYRVTRAITGGGVMSGSYDDPSGMTVDAANVPVQLSFVHATADVCDGTYGISCTAEVEKICSPQSSSPVAYSNCVAFNANNACAETLFTYQAAPSSLPLPSGLSLPSPGTGEGWLTICGGQGQASTFDMHLISGPFAGYRRDASLQSGEFTAGGGVSNTPPVSSGSLGSLVSSLTQ